MKKLSTLFLIIFLPWNLIGQTCQKEEVKISYTNGLEVFNICITNPSMTFDEENEYYWYTEFSKIKSTKGGCGGNLLHGNYKFYDEYGNLRVDKNYSLGLEDCKEVKWDSLGNITAKTTYSKGDIIYWKFLNEDNYWIEFNGPMFNEGTIRKVYTKYGTLVSEEKMLPDFKQHVKVYFEDSSNQLKVEYTTFGMGGDYMYGSYKKYYDNGNIEVEGQFHDGDLTSIKVGVWKWYNRDGSIDSEETYKAKVLFWPNGEMKVAGGYIFDNDNNEWVKTAEWKWYDEKGRFKEKKEYKWGVEIEN